MIEHHIRWGLSIALSFASHKNDSKKEEYVTEMLYLLTLAVDKVANGALDHHSPEPNILGYLTTRIRFGLKRFRARDRLLTVHEDTFKKKQGNVKKVMFMDSDDYVLSPESLVEVRDLLRTAVKSEQEQRIVCMRLSGYDDTQISKVLGCSKANVHRIRTIVKNRLKELM